MDTMSQGTIQAQLVPTALCQAHWIITFIQVDRRICIDISENKLNIQHHLADILDAIEYSIKEGQPLIDELKGSMRFPGHLMQLQEYCRCAVWAGRVIQGYAKLGYIDEFSTDGVPLYRIMSELLKRQSDAIIASGREPFELKHVQGPSHGEGDNSQQVD